MGLVMGLDMYLVQPLSLLMLPLFLDLLGVQLQETPLQVIPLLSSRVSPHRIVGPHRTSRTIELLLGGGWGGVGGAP